MLKRLIKIISKKVENQHRKHFKDILYIYIEIIA
jgi:hypothetical protein